MAMINYQAKRKNPRGYVPNCKLKKADVRTYLMTEEEVTKARLFCINQYGIIEGKKKTKELTKIFLRLHNGERTMELVKLAEKEIEKVRNS